MDEYILNENSWTINYWKNYKNLINIIKFNNSNNNLEKNVKYAQVNLLKKILFLIKVIYMYIITVYLIY